MSEDRFSESIQYICDSVRDCLETYNLGKISCAVEAITGSKQIFVYGAGRSGLVGRTFAMRLMQIGLRAFFIGETITPSVNDEDCVIFVSKTGETQTAIQAAGIVQDKVKARIIVLTASPDSPLAAYGDIVLVIDPVRKEKDARLAPLGTVFENSAMIFLDALISVLMEGLGETEEDMKVRHPILV